MFLKSLEIRGFKSFADKTEIIFNKGITTVVGPNGSGKSNISDAVRWVLGEQSIKTLRGGKMEDVIFAGTQYRKPVGLSQVSLTLDNRDNELPINYSYVTVSRRLYRSGESEYSINNSKCRLKDIQELFMDTGIGKEGYSIIGQGKIDAILSGRPEDRRRLLEEAAGIVKFKTRKEEAEKKLENSQQNLTRIQDILTTYGERIIPLEIEKNKAKEFLKLSEKLKTREINIVTHSIKELEQKLSELKKTINEMENEISLNDSCKKKFDLEKEDVICRLQELENYIEEEKKKYYNNKSDHKDALSKINILHERINNFKIIENKNSLKLKEIEKDIKNYKEERNKKEDKLQENQKLQLELNDRILDLEKNLLEFSSEISEDEKLLNSLKDSQIDIAGEITECRNKEVILTSETKELNKKIIDIKDSCLGYDNSIKINVNTKAILNDKKLQILNRIKEYNDKAKNAKSSIAALNSSKKHMEDQLKIYNKKFNISDANKNILINLEKQYEGYNKTVKLLMNNIDRESLKIQKSDCNILGEVIEVKKELETAVEIALGASISNIITKNDYVAKELIEYLKKNKLGRATFLPLNIIRGKTLTVTKDLKEFTGYIGVASELVDYNPEFKNVIEYVLGRTIVTSNLDVALKIAKLVNYRFKIVTLDGEVVNPGGALTGGSIYHKNISIMSRKREIEELKLETQKLNKIIIETSDNIEDGISKIKKLDDEFLNLKDEIHYENIEMTKVEGKIDELEKELEKLFKSLQLSTNEINRLEEKLGFKNNEITNLHKTMEELKASEKVNDLEIKKLELKLKDRLKSIEKHKEDLTEFRIKKAQIDESVNNQISELGRIVKDIEYGEKSLKVLEKEINDSISQRKINEEEILKNKVKIKDILELLDTMEKEFDEKDMEKIKIKEKIESYKGKIQDIDLIVSNKEKEVHKNQLSYTRYETERESLYSKLNDEFQMTYAEALDYKEEIIDKNKVKDEISEIKSEISKLGVVNLKAIEEYEEIKEKFEFMTAQKEDLVNAKNELIEVIKHMTEKMRSIFNENFAKLRIYFNETFMELFKGGKGDLILGEGDELNCNIDIKVEPPGKKLQNINLMSGGEKVLSAIALLFAILKMKPTPFCILDEIEAALDDANVIRYAEFLKAFANDVQFIVITHRKGTMEASDVMYGVTMQEKGVSKVVSINLSK
ncbi:chromosome segregation protein SMC [Haloimpatiens sp. FM7315]|uniref:chromosome segregation protein SMC n=1 Tax=Haloimpatiens sp. FM7315 TaxID=3298609 RepID=UPI00370C0FE3